jgi:hypothetical protein
VTVDLGERQLFAQLVALPAVRRDVDRLGVERFVESVELLLDQPSPRKYRLRRQ